MKSRTEALEHLATLMDKHSDNEELSLFLQESYCMIDQEPSVDFVEDYAGEEEGACDETVESEKDEMSVDQILLYKNTLAHVEEQTGKADTDSSNKKRMPKKSTS